MPYTRLLRTHPLNDAPNTSVSSENWKVMQIIVVYLYNAI